MKYSDVCVCIKTEINIEAIKMAVSRLIEKNDVAILLPSVENLWNSALAVQN